MPTHVAPAQQRTMKAVIYRQYGPPDVLHVVDVEKPTPKDDEILIRTVATTVTAGDWRMRSLQMPRGFGPIGRLVAGVSKPRKPILGVEIAGDVEAVGKDVTKFRVGDAVFALSGATMGCHAEYKTMPQDGAVARKPTNLSYEEAAALTFGGTTGLFFFRKANLKAGERILINGASGGVGTAAIQLAKHFGAHVTAVCSTANLGLVKALGADRALDYTKDDFTKDGETYDVIMDNAGTAPFARSKRSLKEGGRLLLVLTDLAGMIKAPWLSMFGTKKVIAGVAPESADDLRFLADLAQAGKFKPHIDRRFPLQEIADAHRYVDTGHKRGNVAITVGRGSAPTAGADNAPARARTLSPIPGEPG